MLDYNTSLFLKYFSRIKVFSNVVNECKINTLLLINQ